MKNLSEEAQESLGNSLETLSHRRNIVNKAIEECDLLKMDKSWMIPISLEDDTLLYVEEGQQGICNISNRVFGEYDA